jgi:6-phospho-beta-glucosidase
VLHETGTVPSYYLRHFWCHDEELAQQRSRPSRAEDVARMEQELLAMYADPALDRKPALLEQRGGAYYSEAAVALLASLAGDRRDTQVVNLRNHGTLPFLPADAVIEVPAVIGAGGPQAVPLAPVDPLLRGLIAHVSAYEELAVAAAVHGGRHRVLAALLAHPLVGQFGKAEALTGRLLTENAAYLPWAGAAADGTAG